MEPGQALAARVSHFVVTGSSGRLGAALCEELRPLGSVYGIDLVSGPHTTHSPADITALFVALDRDDADVTVLHAGALHKPNVRTHTEQQFVDLNISSTLQLLLAAQGLMRAILRTFCYTSTTSVFGEHFQAGVGCAWIDGAWRGRTAMMVPHSR